MVWLAFDLSLAIGGFALLAFGRWLIDVVQSRMPEAADTVKAPYNPNN